MISGERRLTPVTRVVAPTPMRYVLAVAAAIGGLAIALVVGAFPVLVMLCSVLVGLSFFFGILVIAGIGENSKSANKTLDDWRDSLYEIVVRNMQSRRRRSLWDWFSGAKTK